MHLEPLLSIAIEPDDVDVLGAFPLGERRLVRFRSGTFTGADGLAGTLAGGGADWQLVRPDGAIEIAAHYALRTDDGDHIEVRSDGLRVMAPEVAARVARGEPVDPGEYYFRTHIRLFTDSVRFAHLNRLIAVSTGERLANTVHIHVHAVR